MTVIWKVTTLRGAKTAAITALMVGLLAGCHPATAAPDAAADCAAPTQWVEASAAKGQPDANFAACAKDQAYQTRTLNVPVNSVVAGVVAQCEVRVDRFEGQNGITDQAADERNIETAKAAVTQYRQCPGSAPNSAG